MGPNVGIAAIARPIAAPARTMRVTATTPFRALRSALIEPGVECGNGSSHQDGWMGYTPPHGIRFAHKSIDQQGEYEAHANRSVSTVRSIS